ncbi:MAG TPA: Ig domain-containing protein [Verrucomicrobiae bacterium]|nr:Ig domain-containing protein [Verrucomicrobiae bacterium]
MIKRSSWILLLALGLQTSWAFSLGGPIGNGPDAYQIPAIGYGLAGDIVAPKNLGEEYRRNIPTNYYAFDANFLDYFGSNGVVAVTNAFFILNNALTNLDSYNYTNLNGTNLVPFSALQANGTAGDLGLVDVKSCTLYAMMEQLGLASSIRYDWALHDRSTIPGATNPCPANMEYIVIQRNFDPITWRPTNSVNGVSYGYTIFEDCGMGPDPQAGFILNPSPSSYPVTYAIWIGSFFDSLTWDDIGGLRYLMTTNNLNMESPPAGSLVTTFNTNATTTITTSNLTTLYLASLTNNPTALQALFPTLEIASVVTNLDGTFTYSFANVVTNSYSTTTKVKIMTITIAPPIGAPYGSPGVLTTNIGGSITTNLVSGDYFIFPTNTCGFEIVKTNATLITSSTNLVAVGTNSAGEPFSQSLIVSFTNHTLQVAPCSSSAPGAALYQGTGKIQFVRADFDSLIGQFWQPLTNQYNMVMITNNQRVTQTIQRTVTQPDFTFSAADITVGNVINVFSRNVNFDQDNIGQGLAGPGTINPSSTITLTKIGTAFIQSYADDTNAVLSSENMVSPYYSANFIWGSFDSSTNIDIYPNNTDIQGILDQMFIQVTPAAGNLPNGTVNAAYTPVVFTASGGSYTPPFIWSAPAGLPPGLILTPDGTLSGTPTQAGTFDFTIQLTDVLSRSASWNYTLTVQ